MHIQAQSLQERQVVNERILTRISSPRGQTAVKTHVIAGTVLAFSAHTSAIACECHSTSEIHSILRGIHALPARSVISEAARFHFLVQQWHVERGATSSITEIAMCRSHLQIIGMGPQAIPMILRQMQGEGDEPDMWFVALQILTGIDPVTDQIRGDFKAMADRWLQWAADIGYAW